MQCLQKLTCVAGSFALNPATGQGVPIWVADYVLGSYGSGAIMAVPAHDTRDHEFAQQYGLPVVQVVNAPEGEAEQQIPFTGEENPSTSCPSALHEQMVCAEASKPRDVQHLQ